MSSVEQRLIEIIATKTKMDAAAISPDLNFQDSGLDSFARIELILLIEEEFEVEFSDSESADVATVSDIVSLIAQKQGQ